MRNSTFYEDKGFAKAVFTLVAQLIEPAEDGVYVRDIQSCLLLNNQWRVVVENQPPVPLLLYPYSGKAVITGDSFASVLPIHCGAASLDSRVSVDAHLDLVGGDRLKS